MLPPSTGPGLAQTSNFGWPFGNLLAQLSLSREPRERKSAPSVREGYRALAAVRRIRRQRTCRASSRRCAAPHATRARFDSRSCRRAGTRRRPRSHVDCRCSRPGADERLRHGRALRDRRLPQHLHGRASCGDGFLHAHRDVRRRERGEHRRLPRDLRARDLRGRRHRRRRCLRQHRRQLRHRRRRVSHDVRQRAVRGRPHRRRRWQSLPPPKRLGRHRSAGSHA